MLMDKENLLSDAQTVTTGSDTGVVSTHKIDLGAALQDIGLGENLFLVVLVTTTLADTGSNSAVSVDLVQDDAEAFSTPTAIQNIGSFAALAAAGSRLVARIQPEKVTERYIGVQFTSSNGALSAGAFTAFITSNIDSIKHYASGYRIS